jgi:hypothetical protein
MAPWDGETVSRTSRSALSRSDAKESLMNIAAAVGACLLTSLTGISTGARADEEKVALKDVPKAVLDAVKAKFPKAEIKHAAKEVEDGETLYEIETELDEHDVDLTLKANGTIVEIEKEIAVKDLPKPVADAIAAKHPKAKVEKAEEIVEFEDGKEMKSYEVAVEVGEKDMELKITPDGKILKAKELEEDDDEKNEKGEKDDD